MVKLVLLSVSVLALMTTSTHAKSLTASVAADGSTCNISPSPKDAYRLLSIATDPTCAANGIGCVSSACRYCRLKRDEKFSNLLICSAIPGFLADGQVFDPSDIIDTGPAFNLACTTTVSSGDAQVGINIVTDVSCTLGGIGCLNDLCRYCKKWETIQSAAFMACTDVDTNNGDDISFSTIPVVTSDPSGPAIGSTDRPTLDVIPLSALTSPITTVPPATMSPTTVPPTLTPTAAPVTLAPTLAPTATPTTVPPTTAPPPTTTAPPVTVPPTVTPTTAPPLTVPPMTTAPPTVAPTTAPPVTAPPMTAPPVTVPPPTVPPPTTKPPTVAPTTAKPPTVAPTTTKPPTVAPTTTKPPTVAPKTTKPPTVAPTTTKPQTVAPPPPTVAPTTASPTTAPPPPTAPPLTTAPSPTIDACAAAVSVGDKNVGVFGFTDPTCQFGGLGCFSTACRFCQGFSTPQSSYLDPCPSTPTTVPPPPTTAPPPPTPAPTRDPCALSVSSGDNNVGISAYTDTLCLSGGLGCFGSTCRFCKTFATPQSEPYPPCPTST